MNAKNGIVDGTEGEMSNLEKAEEAFTPSAEIKETETVTEDSIIQESIDKDLEIKEPTK